VLLFEHEGKAVLRDYGIATPRGVVVGGAGQMLGPARELSLPLMIKAQILSGGRAKAGGIVAVDTNIEMERQAKRLFATRVKDLPVDAVLIEERVPIAAERYMAMLLDGESMLLVIGRKGGIEVEELFSGEREGFETITVDPLFGLGGYQVRVALERLGIPPANWSAYVTFAERLAKLFRASDATLAEINPLAELEDGSLLALDARIVIDDGALFRQARFAALEKTRAAGEDLAASMKQLEVQFVPIGGSIGLVSSGAGVGTTVMDWVDQEGAQLHSFVDLDYAIMGGKTEAGMRLVLDTLLEDSAVRAIIVNFTTCGLRLDQIARSLVTVLDERRDRLNRPVFVHLQGNRAALGQRIVRDAGYEVVDALGDAVRKAVHAVKEGFQ
jgi:succinyl-CoA synthetase beta subunit